MTIRIENASALEKLAEQLKSKREAALAGWIRRLRGQEREGVAR